VKAGPGRREKFPVSAGEDPQPASESTPMSTLPAETLGVSRQPPGGKRASSGGTRSGMSFISVRGARQNNLRGFDLKIPEGRLVVISGVSGSGKSSLALETLYAEGQRRYVETFSAYARQFLTRMSKPAADRIQGIPPAIAIEQTNPVKSSRSTVGTMTEINDYLKLLFCRFGKLHCRGCGREVVPQTPGGICRSVIEEFSGERVVVAFPIRLTRSRGRDFYRDILRRQGFIRLLVRGKLYDLEDRFPLSGREAGVVQDRLVPGEGQRQRLTDSVEAALRYGRGVVWVATEDGRSRVFSSRLHCARCGIDYEAPSENLFSFNSPVGACPTCHGFGRVIEIDPDLVIPDKSKSLREGAVKPFMTSSYWEAYEEMLAFCDRSGIPTDVPYGELGEEHRQMIYHGCEGFFGVRGFFRWLESKSYKMHIRVLLSKYRTYLPCPACGGARLRPEALRFTVGGLRLDEIWELPIGKAAAFFDRLRGSGDEAFEVLVSEVRTRLGYLVEVGLGYLTLGRQSRTLSGGEVQRVGLTSALGSSLVNTLFVLDEPSIGLHPRDVGKLISILKRLRDGGNTIVVVEHDRAVLESADRVIDLGPGAGRNGGKVVYDGLVRGLLRARASLTGAYLRSEDFVPLRRWRRRPEKGRRLKVKGASLHNLKGIDVEFPLGLLVCVTGVSGAGKSTLVVDVLYRELARRFGGPGPVGGGEVSIEGLENLDGVELVDQTPIGRSPRSNLATYMGVFGFIREKFGTSEDAARRGFSVSEFSFNAPGGRCERCRGAGFERVEMQFLPDVYLPCPDCEGKRFTGEILMVRLKGKSIVDVLEMTVEEARAFFAGEPCIRDPLGVIEEVGLGYLKLGQPITTFSGGEVQRLKLARSMSGHCGRRILFLFDEPTTGLHAQDIKQLLEAFETLLLRGHSIVVIEHNLDLIKNADYVIDLGPEGGEEGGRVVACGTPAKLARAAGSYTGLFLKRYLRRKRGKTEVSPASRGASRSGRKAIRVSGAREHNLRNLDLDIPLGKLVALTGVSGSGKSSVAFDIIFSEGQRRYLDTVSAYARQFVGRLSKPEVTSISSIPPTVAIEQRLSRGGVRSTVATVTEIYHYLRLLFAKLGVQYCPECGLEVRKMSPEAILREIVDRYRGERIDILAPQVRGRKGYYKELAKASARRGFELIRVDGAYVKASEFPILERFREHDIDLLVGSVPVGKGNRSRLEETLKVALAEGLGSVIVSRKGEDELFSSEHACPGCGRSFRELDPRMFSFNSRLGACPGCGGLGLVGGGDGDEGELCGVLERCPACGGERLNEVARSVRLAGYRIPEMVSLSVEKAASAFERLKLTGRDARLGGPLRAEILARLQFLIRVGVPYVGLDRRANTLSAGEAQRIRLAAQLGSNLRGVCYVLDEPTIGLHPRDSGKLTETLKELKEKGNTVLVVEHDEETISSADYVIELGPGGGTEGGRLVARGTVGSLRRKRGSTVGFYLRERGRLDRHLRRSVAGAAWLTVKGARKNNLKGMDVAFPLERFVCVTGVSGSGKSSLVVEVLYEGLKRKLSGSALPSGSCEDILGVERVKRALLVDQAPIGRTPRSVPATYVGFLSELRRLFSLTPQAREAGFGPGRFSFNLPGGQCETCKGQGRIRVEMSFLPDVYVPCGTCGGRRYNAQTLDIRFRGKSIADVLEMTVDEAFAFFSSVPGLARPLGVMKDIGLGYLKLGQSSPSLSGGEAQRIKLAAELSRPGLAGTVYVLEEPSTGLHAADLKRLVSVLHAFVDRKATVIVIEHNLRLMAEADYIIDLGPEGGEGGGEIVAAGTPEEIALSDDSRTGSYLRKILAAGSPRRPAARV